MFQRYTLEIKRAIYFSAQRALYERAQAIDSSHLLLGLLTDDDSRADKLFRLRELLPQETAKQLALNDQNVGNKCELELRHVPGKAAEEKQVDPNETRMSPEGKRILACTIREANRLEDYWIDSEHLVLGILKDGENAAATRLREVGLDLENSRRCVIENSASRPRRSNPVLWWVGRRPLGVALSIAFVLGIIAALYLFGFVGGR
jgi:ATP-dependent Clp protease ATP-binding subunit ClpC